MPDDEFDLPFNCKIKNDELICKIPLSKDIQRIRNSSIKSANKVTKALKKTYNTKKKHKEDTRKGFKPPDIIGDAIRINKDIDDIQDNQSK